MNGHLKHITRVTLVSVLESSPDAPEAVQDNACDDDNNNNNNFITFNECLFRVIT